MPDLLSRRTFLGSAAMAAAGTGLLAPGASAATPAAMRRVVRVDIHPAVGIARVGNSADAFFFGPEVPGVLPTGPFKDDKGAMAKQAARFRLYGYDRDGAVVGEITSDDADITWEVTLGNGKASWYQVDVAMDVPGAPPISRRNASVDDRRSLDVQARTARLRGAAAAPTTFAGGAFLGRPVGLGEAFTDERGRLIVLGADGRAVSSPGAAPLGGFADNDGWTDNTADGPVHATVRLGSRTLTATPARVVCGSPNYAPGMGEGLVTLYDTVLSTLVESGRRRRARTDFSRDVWPILARLNDLQWVNEGYLQRYGFGSAHDWSQPEWRERLADPSPNSRADRQRIVDSFRDPDFATVQPDREPQMYGDMVTMPPNLVQPRQWLAVTTVQYEHLRSWAAGDFTDQARAVVDGLSDLPVDRQPVALDRAALDGALGGAFHPGVEFPWIARVPWLWTDDLRLRASSIAPDTTDYGPELTADVALSRRGPLGSLGPGGIIQWMGVPWHADSASCRYGYQRTSPLLPGFWPARIPNSVLTEADYRIVMDTERTLDERRRAFRQRRSWERFIAQPTRPPTLALMVSEWFKLGIVRDRPGPTDGAFPARIKVESRVGFAAEPPISYGAWTWVPQEPAFPIVTTNSDDNTLRSISQRGRMTVLALSRGIDRPEGITRDRSGNLYVAAFDGNTVDMVDSQGQVSTFASGLQSPVGVAMSGSTLYVTNFVADGWLAAVSATGDVSQIVGPGQGLNYPIGVTPTPDGALLVSNNGTGAISRIDPTSGAVADASWITGLDGPRCMAFDSSFRLYVVERFANSVRRFTMEGEPLPLTLTGVALDLPFGLGFDAQGRLYVSSAGNNSMQRITIRGDVGTVENVTTLLNNPGGLVFNG